MKKFGIIFSLIFSFLLIFVACFIDVNQNVLAEENENVVSVSSFEELHNMTEQKTYELNCDLGDEENEFNFTSIENFNGVFDGKGHTIKNLKVSSADGFLALFSKTNGATIKNLKIDTISIELTEIAESHDPKIAILVAEAKATTISNVEIVNSKISLNSIC